MIYADLIDYIFHTLIIIGTLLFINSYSLFVKFITIDSIFSAYHFLKLYFNTNISDSQIVYRSNLLYNVSQIDRYIFYTIQYLFYKIICWIFWVNDITIMYYAVFITIIPPILNYLITLELFTNAIKKKQELVKIIIAKQSAFMVKLFSKIYLHRDVNISHNDLLPLLSNYDEALEYSSELVKNLGVILLLAYIKTQSPNFYYRLTKYVYNYKTGDMLVSFSSETAKITLCNILDNKQWGEIIKPNTCKAIFHLYQMNEDKTDILNKFITNLNFKIIKMFTVWTLASLFNNGYVAVIISFLLFMYKYKIPLISQYNIKVFSILTTLACTVHIIKNYFVISLLCQFGHILIFNRIVYSIVEFIYKIISKKLSDMYIVNKNYNISLMFIYINILIFGFIPHMHILLILSIYILFISIILNVKINIIYYLLLTINSLSNFNIIHLCFLSVMIYIVLYLLLDTNIIKLDQISNKIKYLKYECEKIIKKIYHGNTINSIVFEIMDLDRFPSVSDINRIKKVSSFKDINIIKSHEINDQQIISIMSNDDIEFDDIFDLPDSNFIDIISIDTDKYNEDTQTTTIEIRKRSEHIEICKDFI